MLTTRKRKDIIRKFVKEFTKDKESAYELWKNFDSEDDKGEFHAFDALGYVGIVGKGIFIVEETYEECVETFKKAYPDLKKDLELGLPEFEEFNGVWVCFH